MSVRKENGNWRVKWRGGGRQRSRTFGSEDEARTFDVEVRQHLDATRVDSALREVTQDTLRWYDATAPGEQVYIVTGDDKIKIGVALDPVARLADLQIGSPVPLSLAWRIVCPNARQLEAHRRYAAHRSHGEWFDAAPILAELLNLAELDGAALERLLGAWVSNTQSHYRGSESRSAAIRAIAADDLIP